MSTPQQIADVLAAHWHINGKLDPLRFVCTCGRWEAHADRDGEDLADAHRLHVADQIITAIASGETP